MPPTHRASVAFLCLALCARVVLGADDPVDPQGLPWAPDPPIGPALARAAAITDLGRRIFFDRSLSASGRMSCATCHDPANHFAPANALPVQRGGAKLDRPGTRATPSLAYGATTPAFAEHFYESEDDGDEGVDQGPAGGRTWDGRFNRARDQAIAPLLAANEMANRNEAAVARRAARAAYAGELRHLFGDRVFDDPRKVVAAIGEALEAYQEIPVEFSPYTSKYDAFLRGLTTLTDEEARGLAAFNDPKKGNCAHCHKSQLTPVGNLPALTDYGFVAVGVPRNMAIPANSDPRHFDLGACGPDRRDLADRPEYCGLFRAPTLRNVATRRAFYHNGVFHTLEDAVAFYATRDTNPERWYPVGKNGKIAKFNDLPTRYVGNVTAEPPFGGGPGEAPALSPRDVADIVAFLRTLTDGYEVPSSSPSAINRPLENPRSR